MARPIGKRQASAICELIEMQPGDQYRWTVMGPRESDRAVLVRQEWGSKRPEGQDVFLVGFGGMVTKPSHAEDDLNPREFYPHA